MHLAQVGSEGAARAGRGLITRGVVAWFLAAFAVVVSASFGHGLHLLWSTSQVAPPAAGPTLGAAELGARLQEAERTLEAGKVEQALLAYRRILAVAPSLEAQLGLAEAELKAGREDVAVREFERALEIDGRSATALRRLAVFRSRDRATWPRAEDFYRRHLEVTPDDAEARLALARLLAWQGKAAEAAELFSRPDVQARMDGDDHRDHAFALVGAGRTPAAETLIRRLLESRADDELQLQLAGIHASRREWEAAVPLYRSVALRRPQDARVQLLYGHGLVALGDPAAAVGPLGRAARALPQDGEAGLAHARALRAVGDGKAASREFERVLPLRPRDAAAHREYGDLLMESRDFKGAEEHYRQALDLGLRDVRLLAALAGALQANGRDREAVPVLEEAYRQQPSDRLAFDLARLYGSVGRTRDAERLLRRLEAGAARPRAR